MLATVAIAKALADETRLRALLALRGGELCVCQLIELLQLAPSTVSRHMSVLKAAGLVESEKRGKWVYYRLPDADAGGAASTAITWVAASAAAARRAVEDARRVVTIRAKFPPGLCAGKGCK